MDVPAQVTKLSDLLRGVGFFSWNFIVTQLVKNFPDFVESEGSFRYSLSPPLDHILSLFDPDHNLTNYFLKIYFTLIENRVRFNDLLREVSHRMGRDLKKIC